MSYSILVSGFVLMFVVYLVVVEWGLFLEYESVFVYC